MTIAFHSTLCTSSIKIIWPKIWSYHTVRCVWSSIFKLSRYLLLRSENLLYHVCFENGFFTGHCYNVYRWSIKYHIISLESLTLLAGSMSSVLLSAISVPAPADIGHSLTQPSPPSGVWLLDACIGHSAGIALVCAGDALESPLPWCMGHSGGGEGAPVAGAETSWMLAAWTVWEVESDPPMVWRYLGSCSAWKFPACGPT